MGIGIQICECKWATARNVTVKVLTLCQWWWCPRPQRLTYIDGDGPRNRLRIANIVPRETCSHCTDSDSDPYSRFMHRTRIWIRICAGVRLRQWKWAITDRMGPEPIKVGRTANHARTMTTSLSLSPRVNIYTCYPCIPFLFCRPL